jgi:glucose/mannose-6-phosphate isomerase
MIDLDDFKAFQKLDRADMLGEIEHLPDQLASAWKLGKAQALPRTWHIQRVLVCGMGGSAIGADLVAAHVFPVCRVPLVVHRDYGLPSWAGGAETLVIASSHSGDTEETLDSYDAARRAGCRIVALCTGGELERRAKANGIPVIKFDHPGQPRAAVGFSFGLLLAALFHLELIPDPTDHVLSAVRAMKGQQNELKSNVPVSGNPAKRLAGQLVERWVNVYGAGILAPVARRWKTQINEIAKAGAGFEFLPEADHNALAGLQNPALLQQTAGIFLQAPSDHPRNRLRLELTEQAFLTAGLGHEHYLAQGDGPLAQLWTALHFGDYAAYYLAMAYGVDPTPVAALAELKQKLKGSP